MPQNDIEKTEVTVDGHEKKTLKILIEITRDAETAESGETGEDTSFTLTDPATGKILTITIAE